MGIMDWVTLGTSNGLKKSSGSVSVTKGSAVAATFGSADTHVFGTQVRLVCDPMGLILKAGTNPFFSAFTGIGGNATFTYGAFTNAVYGGPVFDIRRAKRLEKHSNYFPPGMRIPFTKPPPLDPVDPTLTPAVYALSILICLVPAAMELWISFDFTDQGTTHDAHYDRTLDNIKFITYAVTNRLMALLRTLECAAADAQYAERLIAEAERVTVNVEQMAEASHPVPEPVAAEVARDAEVIEDGAQAAAQAVEAT